MKKTLIFIFSMLIIGSTHGSAQNALINPDATYMFAQRDTCDLFMDVYEPAKGSETTLNGLEKPTIIFMFGGGFIEGTRDITNGSSS